MSTGRDTPNLKGQLYSVPVNCCPAGEEPKVATLFDFFFQEKPEI